MVFWNESEAEKRNDMRHAENELKKQQKTAILTTDDKTHIISYEEKPHVPKGNLIVRH